MTAGLRFGLVGVEIEAPFAVFDALNRNTVAVAGANRQEAFLDGEVPRNPEFGSTSAFAGSRPGARPGLRFV